MLVTLRILFEACSRKTVLLKRCQLEREAQVPSGFRHCFGNKINVNQNGTNITLIWNQKLTVRYPFHDENKNYSDFRNFVGQMVILMVRGIQNRSNFLAVSLFVQKKCEILAFRFFFNSAYRYLKPIYKKYTVKT